ncbi:hypothetical protein V6N13_074286 [Hibiscus sabdariffa]|uniref:Myb-like domain-containing protein n=1 Tax=Hibiscus sabdariffa TaxID=183260 RepID=A0ABR2U8C2_9ROSI
MQQEGGHQSQFGEMSGGPTTDAASSSQTQMVSEQSEQLEEASPISYRAAAAIGNPDELMRTASGNRWPREETVALLKIRSDMDGAFRDATVKGPLWEDVSRKLAEEGYKRSAKKCKEKFENVHKYYKRTKDGRTGRQVGKTYKFFSELEALHSTCSAVTPAPATLDVAPISVGIPMPVSSVKIPPTTTVATIPVSLSMIHTPGSAPAPRPTPVPAPAIPFGISFSSDSSSSSHGLKDEDELRVGVGGEASDMAGTSRKRKRHSSSREGRSPRKMMEFFKGLMKQVLQKQDALQQMFLEAMEKREQDRMIREEAWKRQELARLTREHELIAQERALASSRDAAIILVLQKITGDTIQLPPAVPPLQTQPAAAQVVPPPTPIPAAVAPPGNIKVMPIPSEVIMAIPEQPQEIGGSESMEPTSSRWPKAEVLALINLRSGLESRYQEAGPKGPLWEDISAGMSRMGYKRSAKRCKEKWENINKYFKKVKESNKQRPEDAKTCPYFHQLDAIYCKKILGGSSSFSDQNRLEGETSQPITEAPPLLQQPIHDKSENKTGAIVDVRTIKADKSEDMVKELMEEHEMQ